MIVNGFKSKAQAIRYLRDQGHKFSRVLSPPDHNPKVAKNMKQGVLSSPLHLAPFDLSGWQVCPQASKGCAAACLHTAGNPAYMAGKDASRKDKTAAYFKHREAFLAVLVFEIAALERKAKAQGMTAGVRLNATSDLPWEVRTVIINRSAYAHKVNFLADQETIKIMELFPDVDFYDYTKVTKRALAHARGELPPNYHLTFSKTEDNDADVFKVLEAGGNVAAVFSHERYKSVVAAGFTAIEGVQVTAIDGDQTDFRPSDPEHVIVALKAKGDARSDTSGFVLR